MNLNRVFPTVHIRRRPPQSAAPMAALTASVKSVSAALMAPCAIFLLMTLIIAKPACGVSFSSSI